MNIAIIPARSGSTRVPNKNARLLGGHPLMAHSIQAALDSGCFERVYLATDSEEYARIGKHYGATPYMRKPSGHTEADYDWLEPMCRFLWEDGVQARYVAILRPTGPFRGVSEIRGAWKGIKEHFWATSLRAMTQTTSAYKQWWMSDGRANPIMDDCWEWGAQPGHSSPSQSLPVTWRQTGGLEILRTQVLWDYRNITGPDVLGFEVRGPAALDINSETDFEYAEWLVASGKATLPCSPRLS